MNNSGVQGTMLDASPREVFSGQDVSVYFRRHSQATLWVTFGAADADGKFASRYVDRRQDSAIYFVPHSDHWYQSEEMEAALAAAESVRMTCNWGQVVTYGSSMGGFGALAFADRLKADRVLAASPQVSIDPQVVGSFDERWAYRAAGLTFHFSDARSGCQGVQEITVVFDPFHAQDSKHARMICDLPNVKLIPLRWAGHGALHTLNELGLLPDLVDAVVGRADMTGILTDYVRRMRTSTRYFLSLAERSLHSGNNAWAASLAIRAILLNPEIRRSYTVASMACERLGYLDEATFAATRAAELEPWQGGLWVRLGFLHLAQQRPTSCLEAADRGLAHDPDCAALFHVRFRALWAMGEVDSAAESLTKATLLEPQNSAWKTEYTGLFLGSRS